MRKKLLKSTLLTLLFSLLFSINVFAAGFVQDDDGIYYQDDDGTIITSSWIEVSNLWYFLDDDGVCVNPAGALAPDDTDGNPQIVTSYLPFVTDDIVLLNQYLTDGTVVNIDGQYFMTPSASTAIRNADSDYFDDFYDTEIIQPALEQQLQPETTEEVLVDTPQPQEEPTYVWLSATGKKYHSYDHCGNMNPKTAKKVTLERAESLGKTACKNCW